MDSIERFIKLSLYINLMICEPSDTDIPQDAREIMTTLENAGFEAYIINRELTELWVGVLGFEDRYEVSNVGNIRSKANNECYRKNGRLYRRRVQQRMLKPKKTWDGYYEVTLQKNSTRLYKRLHIIVWESFNKKYRPKHLVTNHIDGNKLNNNLNNLEVVTIHQNIIHSIQTGLKKVARGEQRSNLTETQVKNIRERVKNGETQLSLARELNVGTNCIWCIVNNSTWRHIL
jgi:hypothetical protein